MTARLHTLRGRRIRR